jgi:hypothetical protein
VKPGKCDIDIYQGDLFSLELTLYQDEEMTTPVDLSGLSASGSLKAKASQGTPDAEFTCEVDVGAGVVTVSIPPDVTAGLSPRKYHYDLQLSNGAGTDVTTILAGFASVIREITVAEE